MKVNFNVSLRPSSIMHAAEEGFIGAGILLRDMGLAATHIVRDRLHEVSLEVKARRIAEGELLSETVVKGDPADALAIQFRLEELLAVKRAKQAAARAKFNVTVPEDRSHAAG